jgi:hypothetical protein
MLKSTLCVVAIALGLVSSTVSGGPSDLGGYVPADKPVVACCWVCIAGRWYCVDC